MNPVFWLRIINYFRGSGEDVSDETNEGEELDGSVQELLNKLETNWGDTITDIDSSRGEDGLQYKMNHGNILEKVYATIVFFLVSKDIYRVPQLLAIAYLPALMFGFVFETIGGLLLILVYAGIPISMWFEFKAIEYLKGEKFYLGYKIVSVFLSLTIIGVYYYHITYDKKLEDAIFNFAETVVEENNIYAEEELETEETTVEETDEESVEDEDDAEDTEEVDTTSSLRDDAKSSMSKPKSLEEKDEEN